jgi:sterol desaturase/sphingolipid hydroxylase (fatty acid hydroxylase superfamily)
MTWEALLATFGALYLIVVARYFLIAGAIYWALWKRDPSRVRARKLTTIPPRPSLIRGEIRWSLVSSLIYAAPGALILEAWKHGGTALYTDVAELGWPYLMVSAFVYLFIHDTYFYWTHRLMHRPRLFRLMHKVHHESRQPTPWAAFAFHPYEAVVGAIIVPALLFVIPLHVGALLFILILMTVASVLNHTGFEVLPDSWLRGFVGRHLISAAHHNLHHQRYRCNYGLYFRFWDRLTGTDVLESAYDFLGARTGPSAKPEAFDTSG